jgi:ABC-type transport system involved in Fe-S cluster assembly fused permease/ATPase subunit
MTTETKLRGAIVLSLLTLLWTTVMWNNSIITVKEQKNTIDSLTNISDSLYDESFQNSIEAGRYEAALEIYKEKNPKAVNEIEEIKSTQTE